MSSIQVVGVVEALIQSADALFPGGEAPALGNVPLVPSSAQLHALLTQLQALAAPQTHREAWRKLPLPSEPQFLICRMGMVLPALWDWCKADVGGGRQNTIQIVSGQSRGGLETPGVGGWLVEALKVNTYSPLSADINFNMSGLFLAPVPQDKVSNRPASEELPTMAPAPAATPALVATKER